LTHPATKTTDQEVVTMPAAYGIYQSLAKFQDEKVKALKAKKSRYGKEVFHVEHASSSVWYENESLVSLDGKVYPCTELQKRAGHQTDSQHRRRTHYLWCQ